MKKILCSLATIALTAGSFANGACWANKSHQQASYNKKSTNKQSMKMRKILPTNYETKQ